LIPGLVAKGYDRKQHYWANTDIQRLHCWGEMFGLDSSNVAGPVTFFALLHISHSCFSFFLGTHLLQ